MEELSENRRFIALRTWLKGVLLASPIVIGYIPIGIAFGVLAVKAGLSTTNIMLLSLWVYAGSSQLIAIGLIENQTTALSIILTTFIVNLRHLLMSASISPYLRGWRKLEIAAFAYQLTDETFVLHSTQFASGSRHKLEVFGLNVTTQAGWLLGSWLGITFGQYVSEVETLGLDYALPALFLALLVMQITKRSHLYVALLTGALSVAFLMGGISQWNVILATVIGATLGVIGERWTNKQFS